MDTITVQLATDLAPIPHVQGWHTYRVTFRSGRRSEIAVTFFAPNDEAAIEHLRRLEREDPHFYAKRPLLALRRAAA